MLERERKATPPHERCAARAMRYRRCFVARSRRRLHARSATRIADARGLLSHGLVPDQRAALAARHICRALCGVRGMIKVVVLYPHPTVPAAFEAAYHGQHMPLMHQLVGDKAALPTFKTLDLGRAPPFYRMAEIQFADRASLDA